MARAQLSCMPFALALGGERRFHVGHDCPCFGLCSRRGVGLVGCDAEVLFMWCVDVVLSSIGASSGSGEVRTSVDGC